MKQAKRRIVKPRNPVATSPLLKKSGPHQRADKRASRAKQKAQLRQENG
jgi:hypothetical protein